MKGKTSRMLKFRAQKEKAERAHKGRTSMRRTRPKSGGATQRPGVRPWEMGSNKFWPPNGIPCEGENGKVFLLGEETYLKDGQKITCVLSPDFQYSYFHSVQKPADRSVVPERYRKYAHFKAYPCTFKSDPLPPMDDWTPSEKWEKVSSDWVLAGRNSSYEVRLKSVDGGWAAQAPVALAYAKDDSLFEDVQEAMYRGEEMQASAESCVYCAQRHIESLDRLPKEEQTVWGASRNVLLPMFSLRKLEAKDGSADRAGYFRLGDARPVSYCRQGWVWLRSTAPLWVPKNGSRYRTWDNWRTYITQLSCTCKNCLEDGKKSGRHAHEITTQSLSCERCGEVLYGPDELMDRQLFRRPVEDEDTGDVDWSSAGLHQLMNEEQECPECGHHGYLYPNIVCSTCDDPTPLQAHEVLTDISKDPGGYLQFELRKMKDGRIVWYPEDMQKIPLTNPSTGVSVWDVMKEGIEAIEQSSFQTYLDMSAPTVYVNLPPDKQAQFIGASVYYGDGGGEDRDAVLDDVRADDVNSADNDTYDGDL